MCLAIPAKILKVEGEVAEAEIGGLRKKIHLGLMEAPETGDYVLLHAGFAIQKIDEKEAGEILELLKEIEEA